MFERQSLHLLVAQHDGAAQLAVLRDDLGYLDERLLDRRAVDPFGWWCRLGLRRAPPLCICGQDLQQNQRRGKRPRYERDPARAERPLTQTKQDRKSTRLNSSHLGI